MWYMIHMTDRHMSQVDLNLLRALDVLLGEESVSGAARALGLTQPAVSRTLARVRALFGDDLLQRAGRGMRPTARATDLRPRLREALVAMEGVLAEAPDFDPTTSRRRFAIAAVDHAQVVLVAPLVRRLARAAPHVTFVLRPVSPEAERDLDAGVLDLYVGPTRPGSGAATIWTALRREPYTCLLGRARAPRRLSVSAFTRMEHVLVAPWGRPGGAVDEALADRGLRRQLAVQVPTFLVLPHVLAGTGRIATVPRSIARALVGPGLCIVPPPLPVPPFTLFAAFHELHRKDPAHAWLRSELASEACRKSPHRSRIATTAGPL
jgi:DNA-binding transcriptional LysR family regulator